MAAPVRLTVNGHPCEIAPVAGRSLLGLLRDDLGLTGTRYGCGQGDCGACYVLADGRAVAACRIPVADAAGKDIITIEGLARDCSLHPVQQAFIDEDAMQCGACTSGMIISAVALLRHTPHPEVPEIRDALAPHLCRCGVYGRAIRAVQRASR